MKKEEYLHTYMEIPLKVFPFFKKFSVERPVPFGFSPGKPIFPFKWKTLPVCQKWMANFGQNIPTEICEPPPEVILNIPVRRNRNRPFHMNSNPNFWNLWHNGKHPLIMAKKRFVKNGMANFGRNILTEICGPPPEIIPNIPVKRSRNEPFHLNSDQNFRNLWHNVKYTLIQLSLGDMLQLGLCLCPLWSRHTTVMIMYVFSGDESQ